ncbi:MAG: GNAT family N-acetyltransferase [Chloroflexota bacterium]
MIIRGYQKQDAAMLARIRQGLGKKGTAVSLHRYFENVKRAGGQGWVAEINGRLLGAIIVAPLPGLPHLLQLDGFVAVEQQRQGYATQMLAYVKRELAGSGQTLTHGLDDVNSSAAGFLQKQGFEIGYEEWMMILDIGKAETAVLPPAPNPKVSLRALPREQAVRQFITLYDASFSPHPWYQPFTPAEVEDELTNPQDIRFFYEQEQLLGFIWVRQEGNQAEFEPIGVLPAAQGKGYGRWLVQTAVYQAAQQGVEEIHLGVWRSNEAAVGLYQSLGFVQQSSRTYFVQKLQ